MKAPIIFTETTYINDENREMYEVFCRMHPHEAFDLDEGEFCKWMWKNGSVLSNEKIEKFINETR